MGHKDKNVELYECTKIIISITQKYDVDLKSLSYVSMLYSNMLYVNRLMGQEMERELDKIRKAAGA